MKLKFLKEAVCIVGIISMACGLFGCRNNDPADQGTNGAGKKAANNESGITRFYYSNNVSMGGDSYCYNLEPSEDGSYTFSYEAFRYHDEEPMQLSVDKAFMDKLGELYKEQRLAEWAGFKKYNSSILDGSGFSLEIGFADGASMTASGSNSFPQNYGNTKKAIENLFKPLVEEVIEARRQHYIAKGISGTVDFVLANFVQNGSAGSDRYNIILSKSGAQGNRFDVSIKSVSGDFLPAGEYRVLTNVPEELIDWAALQGLIEKYNIIEWFDYDKDAEDYNNSEFFQLSFGFDGDNELRIDAIGSVPPAHYEEFRHEFLSLIAQMTQAAQEIAE